MALLSGERGTGICVGGKSPRRSRQCVARGQSALTHGNRTALVAAITIFACAGSDLFRAHTSVVARVGDSELAVDRLGEVIAEAPTIPLDRAVVERVARLWVDYQLFAQRMAKGDSLLDSSSVTRAMWNDAQLLVVTAYHTDLVTKRVVLNDSLLDRAFAEGEFRVIQHILLRKPADSVQLGAVRRRAEALRPVAAGGAAGWARGVRQSEDTVSRSVNGSLGLIARGRTVPALDSVAFALESGETSMVTETPFGYHILRRPALNEVREEFEVGIRDILVEEMNTDFILELSERWEFEMREDAPRLIREAIADIPRGRRSTDALGDYLGGEFTVADFARWLLTLEPADLAQVDDMTDPQLSDFALNLMRNDVLEEEAHLEGHHLSTADLNALRSEVAWNVAGLRDAMGLDSVFAAAGSSEDRVARADAAVDRYLGAVTVDLARLVTLPGPLADYLRTEGDWEVSPSGVVRALERSAQLRADAVAGGSDDSIP